MNPKLFFGDIARIEGITNPAIHRRIKDKQLKYNDHKGRAYVSPEIARQLIKRDITKQKIAIHTTKGGVGKTTITLNLAYRLWTFGARLLVIDLDQQGNLTNGFMGGINSENKVIQDVLEGSVEMKDTIIPIKDGLDLIPSSLKNAQNTQYMSAFSIMPSEFIPLKLAEIEKDYDIVLIDCPPSLGHIIQSAYLASDRVLSILDPDNNALYGVQHSLAEAERFNAKRENKVKFNILLNKYDARTMFSSVMLDTLKSNPKFKENVLKTIIRTSQEYVKATALGETIFDYNKRTKAFLDIDNLARELLGWPLSEE